jgi:hypothetical protein
MAASVAALGVGTWENAAASECDEFWKDSGFWTDQAITGGAMLIGGLPGFMPKAVGSMNPGFLPKTQVAGWGWKHHRRGSASWGVT